MMDWANSEWMPWYKPDTAGWLELSLAARGVMVEVARKLDRSGQLHLGRRGLPSLATLLRLAWDEQLSSGVDELIAAGRLAWDADAGILSDPEYEQRKRPSSTERVRALRERSRNAGNVAPVPVTQIRSEEIRSEVRDTRAPAKAVRKPKSQGTLLPDDWELTPELVAWAKANGITEFDARQASERFARHWHTTGKDNRFKYNWPKAYQAWVLGDVEKGKIVASITAPAPAPVSPTAAQLERRQQGREMAAAAIALMDARRVGS